jgi:hypothetical protein
MLRKLTGFLLLMLLLTLHSRNVNSQTAPSDSRRFAEFNSRSNPIEMAKQLDSFAESLRKAPEMGGWLVDYEGSILPGAAKRLSFTAENYLYKKGIEPFRLTRNSNRKQGESTLELWLVPPGKMPPRRPSESGNRNYTAAFKWDELYYLLKEEKVTMTGAEPETLDSNYYIEHGTFLDSFGSEIVLPQAWRGRIVLYPKRGDSPELAPRIVEYERSYILRRRFVDPSRLAMEIGAPGDRRKVELWIVPTVIPIFVVDFAPASEEIIERELSNLVTMWHQLRGVQAGSKILVIAYSGTVGGDKNNRHSFVARSALEEIKSSLVQTHAVKPERIVTIDGGAYNEGKIELWLVPPGAIEPTPLPIEP